MPGSPARLTPIDSSVIVEKMRPRTFISISVSGTIGINAGQNLGYATKLGGFASLTVEFRVELYKQSNSQVIRLEG